MPYQPSIRCLCGDTAPTVVPLHRADGSTGVAMLTCTSCGRTWEATATPTCPGPDYADAYGPEVPDIPDLLDEELTLMLLAEDIKDRSTAALGGRGPAVDAHEHHDFVLRKAAFLDRAARGAELDLLAGEGDAEAAAAATTRAVLAAGELIRLDVRSKGAFAIGPCPASSAIWLGDSGQRAYVRQEYLAVRLAEEPENGPEYPLTRSESSAGLFDAEGRAL
ncbi:hypothetical protein ACIOG4_28575 [Streptomyces microflavus]|uniref:hypothetical protein n=1 Tax=Streptomyces microflavus TaxID=1919 RepID=UPI0037F32459